MPAACVQAPPTKEEAGAAQQQAASPGKPADASKPDASKPDASKPSRASKVAKAAAAAGGL